MHLAAESKAAPAVPISLPKASPITDILPLDTTFFGPSTGLLYVHRCDFQSVGFNPKELVTYSIISCLFFPRCSLLISGLSRISNIPSSDIPKFNSHPSGFLSTSTSQGPQRTQHDSLSPDISNSVSLVRI